MRTKLPDLGRQQKNADLPPPPKIKVYLTFPQNCFFLPYDMSNKVPHVTLNLTQGCVERGAPGRFQEKEMKENPTQGLVFCLSFLRNVSELSDLTKIRNEKIDTPYVHRHTTGVPHGLEAAGTPGVLLQLTMLHRRRR